MLLDKFSSGSGTKGLLLAAALGLALPSLAAGQEVQ